jgi:iron complex outermembrane receptor protein
LRLFWRATIWFFLSGTALLGQSDTLVSLPEVLLSAPRITASPLAETSWDSLALRQFPGASLSELLSQHSAAYVRSYGLGSLATVSIRGASADQSTVLWNGLPVSSPALGLNDFALLPVFLIDQARLVAGGQSALWGSGAVGGSLQLENTAPPPGSHFRIGGSLGSFGWQQQHLQYSFGQEKIKAVTRVLRQAAENNFLYPLGQEIRRQEHAATRQWNVLQEVYFQPADRHQLVARIWGQTNLRAIPPTTVQTRSGAYQEDRFLRGSLHWSHQRQAGIWQARLGLFREHTLFADTLSGEESPSDFTNLQGEVEHRRDLSRLGRVNLGGRWQYDHATTTGYPAGREQFRLAFFANWRLNRSSWSAGVDLRQEWIADRLTPLAPAFQLTLFPVSAWSLQLKLNRNFRWPTFNQLFWQPGGNEDLRPEQGWNQEALLSYRLSHFRAGLTIYHRRLNDGLLWRPDPEAAYWSAFNVNTIRAYGLEWRFSYQQQFTNWRLAIEQGYDLNRTYSENDVTLPRIAAGDQLIYTPQHQAFIGVKLGLGSWLATYRHQYTGQVRGVNISLDGFHTGHLYLGYTRPRWTLYGQLDNITNTTYRVIERRPMPGRQWRIGLEWRLSSH